MEQFPIAPPPRLRQCIYMRVSLETFFFAFPQSKTAISFYILSVQNDMLVIVGLHVQTKLRNSIMGEIPNSSSLSPPPPPPPGVASVSMCKRASTFLAFSQSKTAVSIVCRYFSARPYAGIFFVGGQDLQYCRENASEGAKRPSGGRVWEGGVPPPPSQSKELLHFWDWNWTIWCTLWVDFFGEIVSKK